MSFKLNNTVTAQKNLDRVSRLHWIHSTNSIWNIIQPCRKQHVCCLIPA